jgi:AcrR family transcriptional regulator
MQAEIQEKRVEGATPKRLRGHLRVEAILSAAGVLFAEQGYDAVTMTEIAARSGAAIGSLYRFFPTKDVLADALLRRYRERIEEELAALARDAQRLPLDSFADAFVDHALAWASDRAAALVLIEARSVGAEQRAQFRDALRNGLAQAVSRINPGLSAASAAAKVRLLQLIFKMAAANAGEDAPVLAEMRALARLFLRERVARKA